MQYETNGNPQLLRTLAARSLGQQPEGSRRLQRGRVRIALVILLDATASMDPYVEGIKNALRSLLAYLRQCAVDALVGLVVFRDEINHEPPTIYPAGTPLDELERILEETESKGGDTIDESSLPAIMRGVGLVEQFPQEVKRVFLLISDAPPHDPEQGHTAETTRHALLEAGIHFFACTPDIEPYRGFCNATGGTLFPIAQSMDARAFEGMIMEFGKVTVKAVHASGFGLSAELLDVVRRTRES